VIAPNGVKQIDCALDPEGASKNDVVLGVEVPL
jgi:hypothetical protein